MGSARFFKSVLILVFLSISNVYSNVQDEARLVPTNKLMISSSFGYGSLQSPLVDKKRIPLYLVPDIRYYTELWSIENLDIAFNLYQSNKFSLDLIGEQNLDGLFFPGENRNSYAMFTGLPATSPNEEIGEELVPELEKKSMSYMAGAEFRYFSFVDIIMSFVTDISNVHYGEELSLELQKAYSTDNWAGEVSIGTTFKSHKLTNYYYSFYSIPGLFEVSEYVPGDGQTYRASVSLGYNLGQGWFAVAVASRQSFSQAITDSPIVVRDSVSSFFVGVKYAFY